MSKKYGNEEKPMEKAPIEAIMGKVKGLRESKKLSQKDFAQMIGKHFKTVYNWESGKAEPTITDLYTMCRKLGVRLLDVLVEDSGNTSASDIMYQHEIIHELKQNAKRLQVQLDRMMSNLRDLDKIGEERLYDGL